MNLFQNINVKTLNMNPTNRLKGSAKDKRRRNKILHTGKLFSYIFFEGGCYGQCGAHFQIGWLTEENLRKKLQPMVQHTTFHRNGNLYTESA